MSSSGSPGASRPMLLKFGSNEFTYPINVEAVATEQPNTTPTVNPIPSSKPDPKAANRTKSSAKLPKTGDAGYAMLGLIVLVSAASGLAVARRRE
ncbi:LPXTG cell wall anchor domain-containing protein [Propionimicrobium lymphophilum]|uniref:LPXTG cell wall anchor domain-containing protein n=1 Tax=Propionimicrobium lymphophilum TaxID=33012 RepID=UPI003EC731CF